MNWIENVTAINGKLNQLIWQAATCIAGVISNYGLSASNWMEQTFSTRAYQLHYLSNSTVICRRVLMYTAFKRSQMFVYNECV
jgi:hypothetical protein